MLPSTGDTERTPLTAPVMDSREALPMWPDARSRIVLLSDEDAPRLQAFLEANPEYFLAVEGRPPGQETALELLHDLPPPEMVWGARWVLGVEDAASGQMWALVDWVSDLMAPRVWHIGLFIVATHRHGGGDAQALHAVLEAHARQQGGEWLRLGVVQGNARAERFWTALGYQQSRVRQGLLMGDRTQAVRVMVKPLLPGDAMWDRYWALVPRDQP